MKSEMKPHHVGEIVPFTTATCDHLEKPSSNRPRGITSGAIFKDGLLSWLVNGTALEVTSTLTGERHSSWEFGTPSRGGFSGVGLTGVNGVTAITCVDAFHHEHGWKLAVGTANGSDDGGAVYVLDVKTSRLLKSIAIPERVTSLAVVSSAGGINPHNRLLSYNLRYFYGLVAVGTAEGCVYLLDLCLEQDERWPEEAGLAQIDVVVSHTPDMAERRECLLGRNEHLALLLNDGCFTQDHFQYRSPDNSLCTILDSDEVSVSALAYLPRNGCLAVGFNFGGFQIWNLENLRHFHTSTYHECQLPLVRFVFQEPENDPKNFYFLWAVNGKSDLDPIREDVGFATLHSIEFAKKIYVKGIGNCYRDPRDLENRFSFNLCHGQYNTPSSGTVSSRLLACSVVKEETDGGSHPNTSLLDNTASHDDLCQDLCIFVWESTFVERNVPPRVMMAVFDINQWMTAQLPINLTFDQTAMCPYLGFFDMDAISEKSLPDSILDVHVPSRSICRNHAQSGSELPLYPSSLGLETRCLIETGVVSATYLGLHRQIIYDLKRCGPTLLSNPREMYAHCTFGGLLRSNTASDASTVAGQREAILSLALEHNLVDFVVSCIGLCSRERQVAEGGFSLRFLQEWAWKSVTAIKSSLDRQCTCLYDCSGRQLTTETIHTLHCQSTQLRHLEFIFRSLLMQTVPTTDQGLRELESKANAISLLALHLEAVLWFFSFQLLPEHAEGETVAMAYPYSLLARVYADRRAALRRLGGGTVPGKGDLLLIDGLVSRAGDQLPALWSKEGGDGCYPPPSLHALLGVYLLDEVDVLIKHRIVQYLFMDLTEALNADHPQIVEKLLKFPVAFSLSPSLTKITQGFWLLDHCHFEEATSDLLHPIVNPADIPPWQHLRVAQALLYQDQGHKALRYARVRRLASNGADEVRFHLTLLLANRLVPEAYQYQRDNRDATNEEDLLRHLFEAAEQTGTFRELLKLSFSPFEEERLVGFLQDSDDPRAKELLVVYYLQRSRYSEAARANQSLAPRTKLVADPAARERAATRDAIVDGFSRTLPSVQEHLTRNIRDTTLGAGRRAFQQQVPRPQPLSTCVRANLAQPMSRAALLGTVMEKIAQFWSDQSSTVTTFTPAGSKRKTCCEPDSIPLVRTPASSQSGSNRRSSCVIYPTPTGKSGDASDIGSLYLASPSKKSRYLDAVTPTRPGDSARRRNGKHHSVEAWSLLQTPPIRRHTPIGRSVGTPVAFGTPQSILKLRPPAISSPVTSRSLDVDVTGRDASHPPLSLPSTPSLAELSPQSSVSSSFEEPCTPGGRSKLRQLRFMVSPDSKEKEEEEEAVEVVVRPSATISFALGDATSDRPKGQEVHASPRPPLHGGLSATMEEDDHLSESMEQDDVCSVDSDEDMAEQEEDFDYSPPFQKDIAKAVESPIAAELSPSSVVSTAAAHRLNSSAESDVVCIESDEEEEEQRGAVAAQPAPIPERTEPEMPTRVRQAERTAPCMPPAGLDLGEVGCGEMSTIRRRPTTPFSASFLTLLDRTILQSLEGVPCAVDKELAVSSLKKGLVPTERRFFASPLQQKKQSEVPPVPKRVPATATVTRPAVVDESSEEEEDDEEEGQRSNSDARKVVDNNDDKKSSSSSSETSRRSSSDDDDDDDDDSDSASSSERNRHERAGVAATRRIRTLSQVVADMAEDRVTEASTNVGDGGHSVRGEEPPIRSGLSGGPPRAQVNRADVGDAVISVSDDELEIEMSAEQEEAIVPEGRRAVVPEEENQEVPRGAESPAAGSSDAVVPQREEIPSADPPPPASPVAPRTQRRSQQTVQRASTPVMLAPLNLDLSTEPGSNLILTRSRTREQSGSTVSSLSPRQPSPKPTPPKSRGASPKSKSPSTVRSVASSSKVDSAEASERDSEEEVEEKKIPSRPPSAQKRSGPRSSVPTRRSSRSSTPRPSTPFRDSTDDPPLDPIGEGDVWRPVTPGIRPARVRPSPSTDSDRTTEYDTDLYYRDAERGGPSQDATLPLSVGAGPSTSQETPGRTTRSSSRMSARSESADPAVVSDTARPTEVARSPKRLKSSPEATSRQDGGRRIETRSRAHAVLEDAEIVDSATPISSSKPKPKGAEATPQTISQTGSEARLAVTRSRASITPKPFSFSKPTIVAEEVLEGTSPAEKRKSSSPVNTFIFSPPLTRSRSKGPARKASRDGEPEDTTSRGEGSAERQLTQLRRKSPKTPRSAKASSSKSETPIGFSTSMELESPQPLSGQSLRRRPKSLHRAIVAKAQRTMLQSRRSARLK